jgi:hypothetical protein
LLEKESRKAGKRRQNSPPTNPKKYQISRLAAGLRLISFLLEEEPILFVLKSNKNV